MTGIPLLLPASMAALDRFPTIEGDLPLADRARAMLPDEYAAVAALPAVDPR